MVKRKKPSEEDGHRLWWEKTFKEREDLLRDLIGQTDPPGYVISFSWTDVNLVIPGACALCFPPDGSRPSSLALPRSRDDAAARTSTTRQGEVVRLRLRVRNLDAGKEAIGRPSFCTSS